MLIGDHAKLVAFPRQSKHGFEKIAAELAVDPGRAEDHVLRVGGRDGGLAGELGPAIDARLYLFERNQAVGLIRSG